MRSVFNFGLLLALSLAASAADLRIRVLDPQSAAVAGAQVSLFRAGQTSILAAETTSPEGSVTFHLQTTGSYQIRVLAPGFAAETIDVPFETRPQAEFTVNLRLATASETVVVSATRTPVAGDAAGAEVDSLSGAQLTALQPIAADDAMRFLPGAIVNTAGQRGGISSLFVRGGESTYNKVIVDGVAIDNPGETFDFGTLPLTQADRVEFVRGAQSTLYGSDAMTSVVQVWTRTGSTSVPELRFGSDGGNFGTANGYASLSGIFRRFDYNFFGDQFNTNGQGINNHYSDSLQGANAGLAITDQIALRVRVRHSNSYTGVPGEWDFNGDPLLLPDPSEWSHQNNLLGSVELAVNAPSGWQHRFTGFDSLYRYTDVNLNTNPAIYDFYPARTYNDINRTGFEYQGDRSERSWAHTTFGYRVENEVGFVGSYGAQTPGQRLEQDAYAQQLLTLGNISAVAGARFVHNSKYGNAGLPRVALTWRALRGGNIFSGTHLRFSYATGLMDPALYQTFAEPPYYVANPGLLPERTRAFETGFTQELLGGRWALDATYFHNLFHNQIEYGTNAAGLGQFFNVQESLAHGAETVIRGKLLKSVSLNASYTYLSSQYLEAPLCTPANFCDAVYQTGNPLLRRPKHSATTLLTYTGEKWGANLGGSFVGRRPDWNFPEYAGVTIPAVYHAASYALVDMGGWYAINSHVTAYLSIGNALNAHYNEVVGYPALTANFRAGFRFRIGGER